MRQLARSTVMERTVDRLLSAVRQTLYSEASSQRRGVLQSLDPRAKLLGALALLIAVAASHRIAPVLAVLAAVLLLAAASRLSAASLMRALIVPVVLFAAAIALPAIFVTPGSVIAILPGGLRITEQGVRSAELLVSRVLAAAVIGMTLVLTTAWPSLLASLRALRIPAVIVAITGMTYRYVFVLLRVSHEMFVARRSRLLAAPAGRQARQVMVRTGGVLLARSIDESERIHQALISRGFDGEVRLLDAPAARARDWAAVAIAICCALAVVFWGRS